MTTIEYKAYAPTDAGAQTTNTLSASAVAYTRVLDSPNESRLAAVKPPGLDDVHSPCSRPSTQISRVDTRRQLEHAPRVTKDACYFPKRQHISAAVRVVASCYNWASCIRRAPTCRGVCPDAVVLYRHRHSPVQISFLNSVSRVQLFVFLSFWAASPCASNGLNFAYLGHYTEIQCIRRSRTIILTTYRRAEPCKVRIRSTFRKDPCNVGTVTRCGFLHVTRNKAESVTRARCAAGTSRRRVKQPHHRGKYAVGCTRGRSHLPGAGKSRTQLAFLRAPLASSPDLFICCTARKTVRSRAKPEREGRRPRSYHWVSAPPFVTTADNPAKLPLQSLSWLDCGAVPQRRTCTSLLRSPCAHRENATSLRAAAGLACRLGRDRFLKLACRKADNGLSLVTSDFSRALRSEPPAPQVNSKPRAAASTHSNAEFSCFSPNVGTHPCGGVPCSGSPPDLAAGKARQSPSGSEFQRGADAAWNVCAESEWKTYSREELLSDSDKSGISSEKQENGVTNRVLYNVQRFPVDVLSSSPTSGRLRAEHARGREAHLERLAAEKAAAGDGGVGVSEGKREQKRLRTLTWRDYLSWLPPPQPQYNLAQPSRHERSFQEGRKSEVGADQADLVRSLGSTKEHTYDEWKGFPPSASTPIDDLPLESLTWGNETILYRQAFKEAPMIVDEETFRRLKSCWTDAELKRVQREEKDVYGIPEDVPDDCWIPISPRLPEGRLVQEYGLLPNITLTAGGYDYIETYYDPARNYTWSYKRWNPLKQDGEPPRNLEAEARSIYELETEKSRRYWHEEAHPPPLEPDDGIFRQATIADEMTKGMKRTPLGMDQWHYSPTHPLGQAAELQNFWLTAVTRTLPEARARVAAEATAALATVSAEAVLSKDELRSSPATSGLTSEKARTISLPLWIRVPVAEDSFAVDSNVAFRRVSSQAVAASENSPAFQMQPDVEVTPHLRRTRRAVLVESGLRSGGAAGGELTDPKEQEPQRAHAANTSRERRESARGTDTALREALRERCTPRGSSRTDVDGSGGMTTPTAKSTSVAEFTHGSVARIFPIQRSAYQPLAFSDAENGDAGTPGSADDMKYRRLGKSDLFVSEVGLGTMTVGRPPLDGNRTKQLLTYAVDVWGVNFIDTAELYPLPAAPQTYGTAEEIIGDWLRSTGRRSGRRREKLIIATKVAGPSSKLAWLRSSCDSCVYPREKLSAQQEPQEPAGRRQPDADRVFFTSRARGAAECARGSWTEGRRGLGKAYAGTSLSRAQIMQAAEGSLRRLQTDYIDLFQLHWPDRYVPMQASGDAAEVLYDPEEARFQQATRDGVGMEEQLDAIKELLRRGKIRAWGLSNETPYGVCRFTRLATKIGLPPPASVQLQYNLLCRNDVEKGFVELARPQNAGTGLLAYGALAGGVLTGKYLEWLEKPTTGRMLRFPSYMKRYRGSLAARAVSAYYYLALRLGHPNLTVMALRWVLTRPFICSTLLGFTDYYQLRENLYCTHPTCGIISDWTEREINFLHWKWRDPIRTIQ